ncbi:LysE family transporter [Gottfriedia sp. NPDC058432]
MHTLAASIGLSAILYKSNIAFSILKYLGAFYLLYLAYQAFRSSNEVSSY